MTVLVEEPPVRTGPLLFRRGAADVAPPAGFLAESLFAVDSIATAIEGISVTSDDDRVDRQRDDDADSERIDAGDDQAVDYD
ncbi:hypothetical protein ACFWWS_38030, partial [Streptomyces sp. NPDC059083]|uniref:hypothetical protein n=1 Tax=Streptomyces sp. NPDC059083 TaxID=3346721 RepID=UPI00367430BA